MNDIWKGFGCEKPASKIRRDSSIHHTNDHKSMDLFALVILTKEISKYVNYKTIHEKLAPILSKHFNDEALMVGVFFGIPN